MRTQFRFAAGIFAVLFTTIAAWADDPNLDGVRQSHIDGNVPSPESFDALLKRDLQAEFAPILGKPTIEYELLRSAPTQTGVGVPKFYVWVRAKSASGEREGAARVAAVEKTRFDVLQFVEKDEIIAKPDQLETIFPAEVAAKIRARLSLKR